jgi:uncharacterized membrane protein (UPF0127 family)
MGSKKKKAKVRSQSKFIKFGAVLAFTVLVIFLIMQFTGNPVKERDTKTVKNFSAFDFTKHGELSFNSPQGEFLVKIDIEIADDDAERSQGLMYRDKMREDRGMFFIFPNERRQSFWMRNTQLSLDMLFVNSKNEIVTIHKNTTPFSDQSYASAAPAVYVIEVVAGFTDKYNVKEGDKIVWRRI